MIQIHHIRPSDYTYDLPPEKIALFPAPERDHSRLLIFDANHEINEDLFKNIATYLPAGSSLFYNNSRVIPARLVFFSNSGSAIEIFCLKPSEPSDYQVSLSSRTSCIWECMIGNARRFKDPVQKITISIGNIPVEVSAEKMSMSGNTARILFYWNSPDLSFAEIIEAAGKTPLPPYIKRDVQPFDRERYQTVYSKIDGSVAAPTAGLHFTDDVIRKLREKDIRSHEITLHVGAGTFQPVHAQFVTGHNMHAEQFEVSYALLKYLTDLKERTTCVGTTTVRTLESLYWIGVKMLRNKQMPATLSLDQWEPYSLNEENTEEAFQAIINWFEAHNIRKTMASTSFMIVPGYRFQITERLITNFHQPGSSLLLLIAAFIGEQWKDVYQYALDKGFRFLSYGDSSLLFNADGHPAIERRH